MCGCDKRRNQGKSRDIVLKLKKADIITLNTAHNSHVQANSQNNVGNRVRKQNQLKLAISRCKISQMWIALVLRDVVLV